MRKIVTKPEVFIIESLSPDDEGNGRFEGGILSQILKLHGKSPKYRYVRTKKEFKNAVDQFGKSKYRYLHISTHANNEGMCTTNQDDLYFDELTKILKKHLVGRRLFISACSMVQDDLARKIISESKCLSIIGPKNDIYFTDAAIFWSSLYHLMFTGSIETMKNKELAKHLRNIIKIFNVKIGFYSKNKKTIMREVL